MSKTMQTVTAAAVISTFTYTRRRSGQARTGTIWALTLACGHTEERAERGAQHDVPARTCKCQVCAA